MDQPPEEWSDRTHQLYDELNAKLNEYVNSIFEDSNILKHGDYIDSWAVVVNYGNMNRNMMAGGYLVETFPHKTPPHAVKGLFREGVDWVEQAQMEDPDE